MRAPVFQIIAWLWFPAVALAEGDSGGITASLSPRESRPGDLVTLEVTMDRETYGEFALEVPEHRQLPVVSRERVPLRLVDGRYRQGERLVLQPASSGQLTIAGMTARLTEAGGAREVVLPELKLNVPPFETADDDPAPEPFPEPAAGKSSRFPLPVVAAAVLVAGILLGVFKFFRQQKEGAA